jgi:hypothetical protein
MKKFFFLALLLASTLVSMAQSREYDLKSVFAITRDTVVNTATVTWTSARIPSTAGASVTLYVSVTKISGTVGGTLTLMGSQDGTNFKALNTAETQTALATITATDATNTYHWRLNTNPFPFYRLSWTGTGTMSASAVAKLLLR